MPAGVSFEGAAAVCDSCLALTRLRRARLQSGLVEAGRFRPVIDRRYALDEIGEATRARRDRAEDGQRRDYGAPAAVDGHS